MWKSEKDFLFHWRTHVIFAESLFLQWFLSSEYGVTVLGLHRAPQSVFCTVITLLPCRVLWVQLWTWLWDPVVKAAQWKFFTNSDVTESHVLEPFLFVALLHSGLSESQYLTGSDQPKDWHAGVRQRGHSCGCVLIVCANDAWYYLHDCLKPGDQEQMVRDTRCTPSSFHTWL